MSFSAAGVNERPTPPTTSQLAPPTRAADVLVDILVEQGIDTVFGLPGGTIAPLHDALLDRGAVRVVSTRHESGAVFAAASYAQKTGRPGVVLVTSGPGILNCLTGLASAHCDGLPVVIIAGEVPRRLFGRQALQEGTSHHLNIIGIAEHITKLALEVPSASLAPALLRRAINTAMSGRRGPVILTLPLDVALTPIQPPKIAGTPFVGFALTRDHAKLDEVADILWRAERPAILAGSGARWGRGPAGLRRLAERLQCPVMCTPKGKGVFPENHPLSLGVFGHGGHPSASAYLAEGIDTLLTVGTSLRDPATDGWSDLLRAERNFIQIDTDASTMGRVYPVTHGIVGEASEVISALLDRLPRGVRAPMQFGVSRASDPQHAAVGPSGKLTPQRALWELRQRMPADTMFTCDIGEHLLFTTHYLEIESPDTYSTMTGLASMGSSIAAAIGAKLARPSRPVAAICGDGCFAMATSDVMTAAHEGLPIVVAVLNDFRYGMVEVGNVHAYGRTPSYPLGRADIGAIARASGAHALTITEPGELLRLDLIDLLRSGPVVLDVHIDPAVRMPNNKRFEALSQALPRAGLN